jgi:hypothetical protein
MFHFDDIFVKLRDSGTKILKYSKKSAKYYYYLTALQKNNSNSFCRCFEQRHKARKEKTEYIILFPVVNKLQILFSVMFKFPVAAD